MAKKLVFIEHTVKSPVIMSYTSYNYDLDCSEEAKAFLETLIYLMFDNPLDIKNSTFTLKRTIVKTN